MKKLFTVLLSILLVVTMAFSMTSCSNDADSNNSPDVANPELPSAPESEEPDVSDPIEELAGGMFDVTLEAGLDDRLKLEVKDGGYLITYNEIARNEYIAVAANVNIDTSTQNIFTMEYENQGTESVNVSLEFLNADGQTGYGGGDMAPGAKTDEVNMAECHQYGTGTPLGTVTKIQMFFDSGWSQVQSLDLHSGTIFIKSIKLSYKEPEQGPELPDEGNTRLSTTMGDLWKDETVTTLDTDNDTKTVTRKVDAPADGDYGNSVALNITDFDKECKKIVFRLGEGTKFNMTMLQLQDADGEIAKLIVDEATEGETNLVMDLTAEEAERFAVSDKQYFVIWLDANSGNGTGTMVINDVEFYS